MSAIHSTKISRNFGLKLNGSVRSNSKSFQKVRPPFEVDRFSQLDRSDRSLWPDLPLIPVPRCSVFAVYNVKENTFSNCLNWKIYCDDLSSLSFGILFRNIVSLQDYVVNLAWFTWRPTKTSFPGWRNSARFCDLLGVDPRKTSNKFVAQGRPALYFS